MKLKPILLFLVLFILMTTISCDVYEEDAICTCPHGGTIGGWEEPEDTTSVNQKDTTRGLEVILEDWGNSETHDISI